jgi:predicted lactoylglutathione lyase
MGRQIFVNLPVKDLQRSIAFFSKLGFTFNPQFTNEDGTCMIVGDDSFVMLLTEQFFRRFTRKEIGDATKTSEVILAVSQESREKVDEIVRLALEAGGTASNAKEDHGWMYQWSFQDPDGHLWEVMYMDENAIPPQP